MQASEVTLYIAVANFLLTWAIGFYVHLVNKNKATTDRMDRIEADMQERLRGHSELLSRHDVLLNIVPTHDDLGKLYRELNETAGQVNRMAGEMSQMNANLRLLLINLTGHPI